MEFYSSVRPKALRLVLLIAIGALLQVPLFGQATGNVTGLVADSTGAVIPKAAVTLTDQLTGTNSQYGQQRPGSIRVSGCGTRNKL